MVLLDLMESQYYELQLQLYDIQAEILHCEELLLTAQLDSIHRQMTGDFRVFQARRIKLIKVHHLIFQGVLIRHLCFTNVTSYVCVFVCVHTYMHFQTTGMR